MEIALPNGVLVSLPMRILYFLLLPALLSTPALADEEADLQADNRLFQIELRQARADRLYVLLDLRERAVSLKSSGVTLKRMAILDERVRGAYLEPKLRQMVKKKGARPPRRQEVRIQNGEEEARPLRPSAPPQEMELQALELEQMPGRYRLVLDDGTLISVRSEGPGFWAALGRGWSDFWGGIGRLGRGSWNLLTGRRQTEVVLTLSLQDARQLYWSFAEGAACLIRTPSTQDK